MIDLGGAENPYEAFTNISGDFFVLNVEIGIGGFNLKNGNLQNGNLESRKQLSKI